MRSVLHLGGLLSGLGIGVFVGCGDDEGATLTGETIARDDATGAGGAGGATDGARGGATEDGGAATTTGTGGSVASAGGASGVGPIACAQCANQSCNAELMACVTDPDCAAGLQCAATECLASGMASPVCLGGCYDDAASRQLALAAFTCIAGSCGTDCLTGWTP